MNSKINDIYNFDAKLLELAEKAEENCKEAFAKIDSVAEYCGAKVLKAFSDNRVSEPCFYGSTGYGYGDIGRETIDKVFAQALGTEDACALSCAFRSSPHRRQNGCSYRKAV